jgi:phosphopantothenoylcysteine decarboxylase/phosphopantothenate--cysteine ligase
LKKKIPLKILISAGPTREAIDPVRYLSNYSTGEMGLALVEQARKRGHRVIFICGPLEKPIPKNIQHRSVVTALEMLKALKKYFPLCDALIMAAAVADFRPEKFSLGKIKRKKIWQLKLKANPDLLASLSQKKKRQIMVGFALESAKTVENARKKLLQKHLDLIVANQISNKIKPFGKSQVFAIIIDKEKRPQRIGWVSKPALARILLDRVERLCYSKKNLAGGKKEPK